MSFKISGKGVYLYIFFSKRMEALLKETQQYIDDTEAARAVLLAPLEEEKAAAVDKLGKRFEEEKEKVEVEFTAAAAALPQPNLTTLDKTFCFVRDMLHGEVHMFTEECTHKILPPFHGPWTAAKMATMEHFTAHLHDTTFQVKQRVSGRKRGYKGQDTSLKVDGDYPTEVEKDGTSVPENIYVNWCTDTNWDALWEEAIDAIPANDWDWGDWDTEYVQADAQLVVQGFHYMPL